MADMAFLAVSFMYYIISFHFRSTQLYNETKTKQ